MASVVDQIRAFNFYIEGVGYSGRVESVTPPTLATMIEEYKAGGMDMPIPLDVGMEMMEMQAVISGFQPDVVNKWGSAGVNDFKCEARGALEAADGSGRQPVIMKVSGRLTSIERSEWSATDNTPPMQTLTINPAYYSEIIDGTTVIEIDALNMKRITNGVDRLAEIREIIGVGAAATV